MSQQRLQLTWYNKDKALIPTETGKYGYTWVDPADPRYCETHTLVYDEHVAGKQTPKSEEFEYSERADLEPQDDNLLILGESGDVLEALTRVPELAEKYVGKVKLIYIDPPFNTAQTFANYEDNLEHSVWLTMMRDRLLHLKKLLSEDGSIWVHLDYVENHRMRLLLDEIFGSQNFQAEVVWQKADSPRGSTGFSFDQDVVVSYGKSSFTPNRMERTAADNARFSNPDGDPQGAWWDDNFSAPHSVGSNGIQVPAVYGIQHPATGEMLFPAIGRQWWCRSERMLSSLSDFAEYEFRKPDVTQRAKAMALPVEAIREDIPDLVLKNNSETTHSQAKQRMSQYPWPEVFLRGSDYSSFGRKSYIPDDGMTPRTLWFNSEVGHNREAKSEIKSLFPGDVAFATPKPERLLERIIHIGSNPGDIVLDCFAGSGTTAAVAQKMGRRWVTCELVEDTFNRFTKPRLEKVVNDSDSGGITRTKGERVDATDEGLPEGLSADDAQKLTSLLNKAISANPELKKSADIRSVKQMVKTRRVKDVVNWRGGGGFQAAHLSPACFDYDPQLGRVMLTAAASGQVFIESVAANLGFALLHPDDDYVFDGRSGNCLLKVIEGVATVEVVDWLASQVQPGETMVLAATSVMDGVRQHLRKAVKGSRVVAVPDDVFPYSEGGER